MRQSQFFAPTLRQTKADNAGHALLLRGGYIRQAAAGIYSYLPLGWRVLRQVERIVREEMDRAGAVELLMPAISPRELWAETGRDRLDILFTFKDRKESEYLLAPTHEEVVTDIVRAGVSSYKQLPLTLYQVQTKFRDEERPRAGLLRGREFVMKDAYSFDLDLPGLDAAFDKMVTAYRAIFERCGLTVQVVQAAGGGIGGFDTQEFMVVSPSGEDTMLFCKNDGYAANLELATSQLPPVELAASTHTELEKFATPGVASIEQLAAFPGGAPAPGQIKTLVYLADGAPVLLLLRGDHQLNLAKASSALGAAELRPATADEIFACLGAHPGSLGAVILPALAPAAAANQPSSAAKLRIVADLALQGRSGMTTGANQDGFHLHGVSLARDIPEAVYVDLREARAGELSPLGGGPLEEAKCIELGHVFKLGNKYSKAMNATVLDGNGKSKVVEMGCYGIGVSRIVAAVAEACSDDRSIQWPAALAPFEVHLLLLERDDGVTSIATAIYDGLRAAHVDVLFDDRNERPGAKFADADLFGIPLRVVAGKTTRESGEVEIRSFQGEESETLPALSAVDRVIELLTATSQLHRRRY